MSTHQRIWVGIDAGKAHHWAVAVDHEGRRLLSRKVVNDEDVILELIGAAGELGVEVRWAVDISSRPSALLLALLLGHDQPVVYIPGRTVNRMSGAFRGDGKTDAKDAHVIAETARLRPDFRELALSPELVGELDLLTSHRRDLTADRARMVNRLRDLLVGICPALERVFAYTSRPGLVLVTGFQTPAARRRIGVQRLTDWLARRNVRHAADVAERAVTAGKSQHTALPGRAARGRPGRRARPADPGPGRARHEPRSGDHHGAGRRRTRRDHPVATRQRPLRPRPRRGRTPPSAVSHRRPFTR